jgi:large subunit ribosomal protein L10
MATATKINATKTKKQQTVKELEQLFLNAKVAIVADVSGFTVAELTKLRRTLDGQQSKVRVAKNTLIKIATKSSEFASLESLAKGPTAVVVGYEDPVQAAKVSTQYFNELKKGVIRGGVLDGKTISENEVKGLAKLPSKEVLLAQIMGGLDSGARGVAVALSGLLRDIAYLTEEVAKKNNAA